MATYGKLIRRLIPFLLICYIVAMIDRLNIGYAKLEFLKDLHLNEAIFGLAAGTYYARIAAFDAWTNDPSLLNLSAEQSFVISTGGGSTPTGGGDTGGGFVGKARAESGSTQ